MQVSLQATQSVFPKVKVPVGHVWRHEAKYNTRPVEQALHISALSQDVHPAEQLVHWLPALKVPAGQFNTQAPLARMYAELQLEQVVALVHCVHPVLQGLQLTPSRLTKLPAGQTQVKLAVVVKPLIHLVQVLEVIWHCAQLRSHGMH